MPIVLKITPLLNRLYDTRLYEILSNSGENSLENSPILMCVWSKITKTLENVENIDVLFWSNEYNVLIQKDEKKYSCDRSFTLWFLRT